MESEPLTTSLNDFKSYCQQIVGSDMVGIFANQTSAYIRYSTTDGWNKVLGVYDRGESFGLEVAMYCTLGRTVSGLALFRTTAVGNERLSFELSVRCKRTSGGMYDKRVRLIVRTNQDNVEEQELGDIDAIAMIPEIVEIIKAQPFEDWKQRVGWHRETDESVVAPCIDSPLYRLFARLEAEGASRLAALPGPPVLWHASSIVGVNTCPTLRDILNLRVKLHHANWLSWMGF